MEKKQKVLELRQRLDKTLALPDLVNEESIKSLVKNQRLCSSLCANEGDLENVVSRRTKEVSNFLEMLRSTSENEIDAFKSRGASQHDWKIKQDTDELRVLYREGTRFHALLTEGCADGSIDVCLCVSWESTLYKKWWPQSNIPTFKITMASSLQKVRIGEEISLVRMKVPWPVSDREALLHYYEIEYFKEDIVLVLINTISDMEHIDVSTHGFTRDGIPEAKDTVRVDLVGGFVLQKVDANRSYFRTIMSMDIKLDFVPPSLINFMSRQLVGNGYKLYQKTVGSVAASDDDDYREALKGPMYVRIREGLEAWNKHENTVKTAVKNPPAKVKTVFTEIVEEEAEHRQHLKGNPSMNGSPTNPVSQHLEWNPSTNGSPSNPVSDQTHTIQKTLSISPEVERALRILDRAIAVVRGGSSLVDQEMPSLESFAEAGHLSDEAPSRKSDTDRPSDVDEGRYATESFRGNGVSESTSCETHLDSESPKEMLVPSINKEGIVYCSSFDTLNGADVAPVQSPILDSTKVCDEQSLKVNMFHENGGPYNGSNKPKRKKKNQRLCCLRLSLRG